jgi:hypothetical protein
MKYFHCILAIVLTVGAPMAFAQSDLGDHMVLGHGLVPCEEWTKERRENSPVAALRGAWVLGYLTAVNRYAPWASKDIAEGMDTEAVWSWIDNYCAQNPGEAIAHATAALVSERRQRAD